MFDYLLNEPLRAGENRLACPACPERKTYNKFQKTLAVRDQGDRITYHCWHCDSKGAIRKPGVASLHTKPHWASSANLKFSSKAATPKPVPKEPAIVFQDETDPLNEDCYEFLEERRISRETADHFKLRKGKVRGTDAVGFPYFHDGRVTGYKLRSIELPKKEGAFSIIGKVQGLFGTHVFDPALGHATILEGEFDPLACYEAGLRNVLSIPHGAISPGSTGGDTKLAFLGESEALFRGLKRIVVATDNDAPGKATADEIARRIGRYRVYRPVYPEGCKDANDVLIERGNDALRKLMEGAKAEDIPGLTKPSAFKGDLMRFRRGEVLQGLSTGYECLDPIFRITPGVFTTVTGHPNHGKSAWVDQIHVNMAVREDWNFGIWSRENAGFVHTAKLIELFQKKRFHPDMNNVMSEREIEEGFAKVEKHATFITSDGGPDTMESILERMTGAVMRYGIKSCVIDPYNYIQKNHEIAREDLQISDMLTLGTDWSKNHECHVFFIAHPKTIDEDKVPTGSAISGGCYSDDTECLTKRGWVLHQDLRDDDEVAIFDPEDWAMRYETPEHRHVYDHDGEMHHWLSEGVNLLVTPNHRMLLGSAASRKPSTNLENRGRCRRWRQDGGLEFELSENIPSRLNFEIPVAAITEIESRQSKRFHIGNENYPSNPFWWYVGFWVAEGCMQQGGVSACQLEENSETPIEIMREMGLSFNSNIYIPKRENERPMWTGRVYQRSHPEFCAWMAKECGEGCENKKVPVALFSASAADKRAFLDGLVFGDGSENGEHSSVVFTTSKSLADGIQRLAVELGIGTRFYIEKRTQHGWKDKYVISLARRKAKWINPLRHKSTAEYTGKVYCLTVSTGAYFVRRGGIVSVCGNSTFNAKTDFGLTIHRPEKGRIAEVHNWKTRHSWLGKIGKALLQYDVDRATFYDLDNPFEDPFTFGRRQEKKGADVVEFEVVNGGRGRSFEDEFFGEDEL